MTLNFINSILASPFKANAENDAGESSPDGNGVPETPASVSVESLPMTEKPPKTQVLIRIRPSEQPASSRKKCGDLYTVKNPSTLLVKHFSPNEAARRTKAVKSSSEPCSRKKYAFTKIFDPETDQLDFFNEAVRPAVVDFLNSRSSTIVSYGTTDAGKTYTLFGLPTNPGVIPRSIEFIYSSIDCTLTPWYKPKRFCSLVNLNEGDRSLEVATKEKLLSCRLIDSSLCEDSYEKLESSRASSGNQEVFKDSLCSVWISFVEIYKDAIYDLLEVDEDGKNMQLKLAVDRNGLTYIQGMRSVCATTGLEAYEILNAGQSRLSTLPTSNYKSSRSHSIFTIKLLKYNKDSTPADVQVTSMTFYDLAGTGRIQKSLKDKKEWKESCSINTSLLALGRCFKFVAQGRPRRSAGPFRDSKLTRLFQGPLCGHDSILLLVNINLALELYAETQNVLNFASTAMKSSSSEVSRDDKFVHCYSALSSPRTLEARSEITVTPKQVEFEDLSLKNQQLATQLKELQSAKWKNEYDLRKELASLHAKQMHDLEVSWKNRMRAMEEEKENLLQFTVSKVKNFYKEKLEECTDRKRRRSDRGDFEDRFDPELFAKGDHFSKILSAKKSMESIKNENKELGGEKNKYAFELSLIKKCLKKLVESVNISCEDTEAADLTSSLSMLTTDSKVSLDEDVKSNLITLQNLVLKLKSLKKETDDSAKKEATATQEVQCDSFCLMIIEFCKDVQNLFDQKSVDLPDLNDSLDSFEKTENEITMDDTTSFLFELKESVIHNISKTRKLEKENFENLEDANKFKREIRNLEKEILQLKDHCQQSELKSFSLSKQLEDLTKKSNSRELFKNYEYVVVESENCLALEQHSTSKNSLSDDLHLSISEIGSEKNDSSDKINSCDSSSRNDSGLTSSIDCAARETIEKCSQTNIVYDEMKNNSFKEKFEQLKLDYKCMKAQHLQESLRVSELSHETERIREAMAVLRENSAMKEKMIVEYKNQLNTYGADLEVVRREKQALEEKCNELRRQLLEAQESYEKRIAESQELMKAHEEGENKAAKCLDDCYDKTLSLRSELASAYSKIEKTSDRCFKEHVLKIDELEKKLNVKKTIIAGLEEKLFGYEKDLSAVRSLSSKVADFEVVLEKMEEEKEELRRSLSEQLKTRFDVERKVAELTDKIEERDGQVTSLKSEISIILRTNLSNNKRAKEFGREIGKLLDNFKAMKDDVKRSEESWKTLERNCAREIGVLRDRLDGFKENSVILNTLCETQAHHQTEAEKLKMKLVDKENELEFFKKNRNATIQRYECLVQQLQSALKVNNHPGRLRRMFPYKHKYFFRDAKETQPCGIHAPRTATTDRESPEPNAPNHTFSFSSSVQVTHSFSGEAADDRVEVEEESACLLAGARRKYSEMRKKAPLQILPTQYEEPESSTEVEKLVAEEVPKSRKSKSQKGSFLHRRKRSKDLGQ